MRMSDEDRANRPDFFSITTLGERGQIVIPKDARTALELNSGDKLFVMPSRHGKGILLMTEGDMKKIAQRMSEKAEHISEKSKKLTQKLQNVEQSEQICYSFTMADDHVIKVGIGVLLFKDGKILLAKRKGSHGAGEYAFTGGHLEFGESFEDCARRETREETGMEIDNIRFNLVGNFKKYSNTHYVHLGLIADWKSGEPKILEPNKNEEWKWYDLDNLPSPLFEPSRVQLEAYMSKPKQNYFDS